VLVSVIIPHLRGTETLLNVLEDLEHEIEVTGDVEVILIDNASTDGSVATAKERFSWVTVVSLPVNQGYAGGCNEGIKESSGKWVWLINDDIRIDPGALSRALSIAESAPDIAAVQPKILSLTKPGYFDYAGGAGGLIDSFGYSFALGRIGGELERDLGQYDESREIFWASGTACLWRRETLNEIGLLDDSFFAHMEEIDLAWRAWNAGWRIMSAPESVVKHLGGGTLSYHAWKKMYLNHRNNLITILKNSDNKKLFWLLPARFILDHLIAFAEVASGKFKRLSAVSFAWTVFTAKLPVWLKHRKILKTIVTHKNKNIAIPVYKGCILFAYARGIRSTSTIAKRQ